VVIRQGDVCWIELDDPSGSEPGYSHPHVVIQNDLFNASKINTTIVCALTSNLQRATAPGNVLLEKGEANLPKPSVVVVTQIITVDRAQIGEYIGSLSAKRISKILAGIRLVIEPRDVV
jgi:mRNA interferase MazF